MAQQHLRNVVAYLDMPTLNAPELYLQADRILDDKGNVAEGSKALLQGWMDAYVAWVRRNKA